MKHPRLAALLFAATIATAPGLAVASSSQADELVQLKSHESGECLAPVNNSSGAAIVQVPCNGAAAQQWREGMSTETGGTSSNAEHFVNNSSQLCLDARGGAAAGTPIEQWPCNWISNENWGFGVGTTVNNTDLVSLISTGPWQYCISTPGVDTGAAMSLYSCDSDVSQYFSLATPSIRVFFPVGISKISTVKTGPALSHAS